MIRNPTAKYWKQTHHSGKNSRKNSVDEFNDSGISNHSSLSTGYNRFKFQPRENSTSKRENLFQYTAKNKQQPFDVSELVKRSENVGSKKSLDLIVPQRDIPVKLDSYRDEYGTHREKGKAVKDVAKELKFLTYSLKRAIQYFSKQLRELKIQWDSSIKQLLKLQISFQNTAILQLRECLQQKEKQIQRIKLDFSNIDKKVEYKESTFKIRAQSHNEVSLTNLAISKIEQTKSNQPEQKLSRNNTLNSLLGQQKSNPTLGAIEYCRESQELSVLKQAVKRMREVLDINE